jgi:hypothetical protein
MQLMPVYTGSCGQCKALLGTASMFSSRSGKLDCVNQQGLSTLSEDQGQFSLAVYFTCPQGLLGGRRTIWPGPQAQRMSKFRKIFVKKSSCELLSWIAIWRNSFKKYLNLDSLECFTISPLHYASLSVCLHQWIQVNALPMCWNRLRTITVQQWTGSFEWYRHAQCEILPCTKAIFIHNK